VAGLLLFGDPVSTPLQEIVSSEQVAKSMNVTRHCDKNARALLAWSICGYKMEWRKASRHSRTRRRTLLDYRFGAEPWQKRSTLTLP